MLAREEIIGCEPRCDGWSRKKGELMGEGLFQPLHLLVILAIALLVFGPKKLPELGKGLGEMIRGFKDSFHGKEPLENMVRPPRFERGTFSSGG